jgi:hypothetical protein
MPDDRQFQIEEQRARMQDNLRNATGAIMLTVGVANAGVSFMNLNDIELLGACEALKLFVLQHMDEVFLNDPGTDDDR